MTPEREAQMRGEFEKWQLQATIRERRDFWRFGNGVYAIDSVENDWQNWLACARALEPMVRDGERYRFIRSTTKAVRSDDDTERIEVTPDQFDAMTDAAMSAALEEEKNANQ